MGLGGVPQKKMMNIFIGDLYSMYVILQAIGSFPCIKYKGIYHRRKFRSQTSDNMDR